MSGSSKRTPRRAPEPTAPAPSPPGSKAPAAGPPGSKAPAPGPPGSKASSSDETASFWEQAETVARFAEREADHRLVELAKDYAVPSRVQVLDLGCAGGRNAVLLARLGFEVRAMDSAQAMVEETRRRLAAVLGDDEAGVRVRVGPMDRLDGIGDGSVDLIVALGVYHNAASAEEWNRSLAEAYRVLARGGRLLISDFTDKLDPEGKGLKRVAGEDHVFLGLSSGRVYLLDADELDGEMARHGFIPFRPTETVTRETENGGRRVTANGLYLKP